jgi:hypothetical protein
MTKSKRDLIDLKPGCYVLVADVNNPRPDKRVSRNWTCAPVWKKGMRLYVREHHYADDVDVTSYAIECIDERWSHMNVQRWQNDGDRWNALAASMQPVDENLDYLLHRRDIDGTLRDILQVFIDDGRVSLADVKAAHERVLREAHEQWVAEQTAKEKQS